VITTGPGDSAAKTAMQLNSIPGVSANAITSVNLSNISPGAGSITISGEKGPPPSGDVTFEFTAADVDVNDPEAVNDYLAEQINSNEEMAALGIRAITSSNTDDLPMPELRLVASSGVDLRVTAGAGPTLTLSDGSAEKDLIANQSTTVGGRIDIPMAD